jgi:hypothetical protein
LLAEIARPEALMRADDVNGVLGRSKLLPK